VVKMAYMDAELIFQSNLTDFKKARRLQEKWAGRVREKRLKKRISWVAGADVAFPGGGERCLAGVVLLRFPELEIVEKVEAVVPCRIPYVPGFLSFREAPAIFKAMEKLSRTPDVLLVDGQGLAHPRRFGLACHLGVGLGLPTIGCGKSRLIGEHAEVGPDKGANTDLIDRGEVVGSVLRSRTGVSCIYISAGHLVDLESALKLVLACSPRYRVPEPTRQADKWVSLRRLSV
jgi:deoxyribonuclease V